jgi:hypothetical protein
LARLHGCLEIDQMIFEPGNAGAQDAASFGEVNDPAFEGDDPLGVGHAHGSRFYSIEPLGVTAFA